MVELKVYLGRGRWDSCFACQQGRIVNSMSTSPVLRHWSGYRLSYVMRFYESMGWATKLKLLSM